MRGWGRRTKGRPSSVPAAPSHRPKPPALPAGTQRPPQGQPCHARISAASRGRRRSSRSVTMTAQEPRSPAPAAPGASPPPPPPDASGSRGGSVPAVPAVPPSPCPHGGSPQPPAAPLRPDGAAAAAPPEGVPRGVDAGAAARTCARGRRGAALSRSTPAWGRRRWRRRYRCRCRCRCRCGRCPPRPCGPALPRPTPALPLAARGGDVTASHPNTATTPGPALRIRRKGAGRGGTCVTMATGTTATGARQPSPRQPPPFPVRGASARAAA